MSTRSAIIINEEGRWKGIYCHFDGYIEGVGLTLDRHYSLLEKAKRLIAHGDISVLAPLIGRRHSFNEWVTEGTTFYHRDRGDAWEEVKPFEASSCAEVLAHFRDKYCEFFYMFKEGKWFVQDEPRSGHEPVPVKEKYRQLRMQRT